MTETIPSLDAIDRQLGPTASVSLHGLPQAGKDSQGHRLANVLNAEFISSGDIFRRHKAELPDEIRDSMDSGELVETDQDNTFERLVLQPLAQRELAGQRLVLSGVGRKGREEAGKTTEALMLAGHALRAVVYLEISEQEARDRWAKGRSDHNGDARADDAEEAFERRLVRFIEETVPALEFYESRGLLLRVSAAGEKQEVTARILASLANFVEVN